MKSVNWDCVVSGTAGNGEGWSWSGACTAVDEERAKSFAKTLAFQALVGGRAHPATCGGPYKITEITVRRRPA